MPCAEGIVGALTHYGKAGKSAGCTKRVKGPSSARKKLMNVGLMTYVKNDMILWRIKYSVKRNRKLDYAKVRGKVAARPRHIFNKELAYLIAKRGQLLCAERLERACL